MSYPKNAATPPRIAVGAVVQISDGAVQTSGVSISVVPQGGSAAAGLGTTSYEDGVVLYAPTQAETNYDAFVVVAYKTGCIPATTTVVTSDTATPGRVRLSGETHSGATIPTVTTVTNRVSANTDQWGGVVVTGMPMPTYTQPTGFLAATFPGTVASTTNITTVGAVSGSVGSISGVTFPTNFGLLLINSSGHISRVTLVDTTTTNTDMRGTDGAALASIWTSTVAGRIDVTMSTLATQSSVDALAAFIDTEVADIKAKTDNLPAAPAAVGDIPTVAAIADAVLDELLSGHTIPGSVGTALAAASSAGDPWFTLLPGSYPPGSAGAIIGAVLAAIDAVPTAAEIDAVLTAAHGSGSWVGAGSTSSGGDTSGLSSEILAAAGGPAEVQNGDQKVKARSIAELIEADKHLAAKTAAADPGSIFRRITPPGAR